MECPVKASSGIYYEKAALQQKIREEGLGKAKCLITRKEFTPADENLVVDGRFAERIRDWKQRNS
jgi:hypothetical protein